MSTSSALDLSRIDLQLPSLDAANGVDVLRAILGMAESALRRAVAAARSRGAERIAAVGRLRGTGRGIHFGSLMQKLETEHPLELVSPFEESLLVAGAVWDGNALVGRNCKAALAKLRWSAGADDLPMHVHDFSDRFIIVHEGRGFFHVSNQSFDGFDGSDVRSIPVRERDVFLFTRGVVHTFSTLDQQMTLLSCQLPYLAFEDPDQFRIPKKCWTARDNPEPKLPLIGCDPAWTLLANVVDPKPNSSVLAEMLASVPPL